MKNKKKLNIGKHYPSNNCGEVEVLENVSNRYWKVKFINTGTEDSFREDAILAGCIRDKNAPLKLGIGSIGNVGTRHENKKYYGIWRDMLGRCYDQNNKRYKANINVVVCKRWLCFENFLEDCPKIDGWDEQKFQNGEIVLDKDKKQRYQKNKVYSKDTCSWLSASENNVMQDGQMKPFVAISPEGTVFHDYNITDFARKHNLERKHISGVLHGRAKTTSGWKFFYEEIV